jgi:hypothetical protein
MYGNVIEFPKDCFYCIKQANEWMDMLITFI